MTTEEVTGQAQTPWSREDEKNWVANRRVLRDLKKRGEEPSVWLADVHAELDSRRKARREEERRAKEDERIRAHVERTVAAMPPLTVERCREIISILTSK